MGWTYTHFEAGEATMHEWFSRQFGKHPDGGSRIIKSATVGMREWYAAYRTNEGKVCAMAFMLDWRPKDEYNFGWKDMEEGMGPNISRCPESILKLLSPVDEVYPIHPDTQNLEQCSNAYAKRWRERCWALINGRKLIKKGCVVEFTQPVRFTSGSSYPALTVINTNPMRLVAVGSQPYHDIYYGQVRMSKESILANLKIVHENEDAYLEARTREARFEQAAA